MALGLCWSVWNGMFGGWGALESPWDWLLWVQGTVWPYPLCAGWVYGHRLTHASAHIRGCSGTTGRAANDTTTDTADTAIQHDTADTADTAADTAAMQ